MACNMTRTHWEGRRGKVFRVISTQCYRLKYDNIIYRQLNRFRDHKIILSFLFNICPATPLFVAKNSRVFVALLTLKGQGMRQVDR